MRQATFDAASERDSGDPKVRAVVGEPKETAASLAVASSKRLPLARWLQEKRAFEERVERVAAWLATPEGEAWSAATVAELRGCAECQASGKVRPP